MNNLGQPNENIPTLPETSTISAMVWARDVFTGLRSPIQNKLLDQIVDAEIDFSEDEKKYLREINNNVREYVYRAAGVQLPPFSNKNIHLLKDDDYVRVVGIRSKGFSMDNFSQLVLNADIVRKTPLHFVSTLIHELLHLYTFKEVGELHNNNSEKIGYVVWRSGFLKPKKLGAEEEYVGIEESLVTETQIGLLKNLIHDGYFKETLPDLQSEEMREKVVAFTKQRKLNPNNIIYVGVNDEDSVGFAYESQRAILGYIVKDMTEKYSKDTKEIAPTFRLLNEMRILGSAEKFGKVLQDLYGEEVAKKIKEMGGTLVDPELVKFFLDKK